MRGRQTDIEHHCHYHWCWRDDDDSSKEFQTQRSHRIVGRIQRMQIDQCCCHRRWCWGCQSHWNFGHCHVLHRPTKRTLVVVAAGSGCRLRRQTSECVAISYSALLISASPMLYWCVWSSGCPTLGEPLIFGAGQAAWGGSGQYVSQGPGLIPFSGDSLTTCTFVNVGVRSRRQ